MQFARQAQVDQWWNAAVRIGTWNLAGRWTAAHLEVVLRADADVWLLIEVSERLDVPGHTVHPTTALMAPRRRWAAVASREPFTPQPDPHPASAAATVRGTTFVSSILPWRGSSGGPPWVGETHAARVATCLAELTTTFPTTGLVWGGDWNHALSGTEVSGSLDGRRAVLDVLDRYDLVVPTADLGRSADRESIDHIAVGRSTTVHEARRIDHRGLSDHDACVVDVAA